MAKIIVNNPKQVINGGAKKYYFKVKGLGGPKGDKGDKGDTGSQGPQGPQGNAATVSVGSTTTLPVGQDATVQNVGTLYNAVLNFGIPQGPRGPQGATGATGAKGDKGDQGNPGPQGEKGTNATVYVGTTSTLNPGSQATVYNSGTDSNAVLNFGIPKGEKGDTGPMPTIAQSTGQATDQVMSQKATTDALNTKQATITSSNKLSADLVTDTSTTNKFVTASDITNWNAKQDALTAGTGIDITDGVISTPAIVPEVVTELPTTGAEGKLYLTPKAHTTQTATGNPITASVTEQAGALESFQLDGDTYQQSYTGKNLCSPVTEGFFINNTANRVGKTDNDYGVAISVKNNTSYTISSKSNQIRYRVTFCDTLPTSTVTVSAYSGVNADNTQRTITIDSSTHSYLVVNASELSDIQVEEGSTATSYEPYVGGVPSPNPDYPQQIQTVTGVQTVSINGTNYPINLGSIELCKIGTYQDYIYKSGNDWKVHKAIKKIQMADTTSWVKRANGQFYSENWAERNGTRSETGFCSHFIYSTTVWYRVGYYGISSAGNLWLITGDTTLADTTLWQTWLDTKKPISYQPLATATDTVITDQELIAQLEAVRTASLQASNTITNTATGTNLAGDMEIGYFGFNPTNRYDKFIWLNLNNNYEQIGS